MKKWLFRTELELHKRWWHRLAKVVFLMIFTVSTIGSLAAVIFSEPSRDFLNENNIDITTNLYDFTSTYKGGDQENTIADFFNQDGYFGILHEGKIYYTSSYNFDDSICIKEPSERIDDISAYLFPKILADMGYQEREKASLEDFKKYVREDFASDPSRKCWTPRVTQYDDALKDIKNTSRATINYEPNFLYFIKMVAFVTLIATLSFLFFVLIYYQLFIYIIFGGRKKLTDVK